MMVLPAMGCVLESIAKELLDNEPRRDNKCIDVAIDVGIDVEMRP
jgi:hypothetical protein